MRRHQLSPGSRTVRRRGSAETILRPGWGPQPAQPSRARGAGRFAAATVLRWLTAIAFGLFAAGLAGPSRGYAAGRYAAMAIDVNTGHVLHAEAVDEARHPASLTKMMTLYLVFEQLEAGRLTLATRITLSPRAANAPPSKLGLEAGSSITLADAIKALVTKSANDVAVAIAEQIAGDEARFAAMMTRKARALGMNATTFRNANGLPDDGQITTARDMILLGMRLYDHFPRHVHHFALRTFQYGGRNYRNHNTMLDNYPGMEGLKTGYTAQSGFNLVASVRRDGRHVIAVVFGGSTATVRNARMRVVLDRALARASRTKTRQPNVLPGSEPARVANVRSPAVTRQLPPPPRKPVRPPAREAARPSEPDAWHSRVRMAAPVGSGSTVAAALLPPSATVAQSVNHDVSTVAINRVRSIRIEPAGAAAAPTPDRPGASATTIGRRPSTLEAQAEEVENRHAAPVNVALKGALHPVVPAPAARPSRHSRQTGEVQIQIGAYANVAEALQRLESLRQSASTVVGSSGMTTPAIVIGGRTLYRARFTGFDAATAAQACTELRRRRVDCLVAKSE